MGMVFFIEQDEIDGNRIFQKSCSVHLNGMGSVKNSISLMPGCYLLFVGKAKTVNEPQGGAMEGAMLE